MRNGGAGRGGGRNARGGAGDIRGGDGGGAGVLWTLFAYEMRMLARDRRTLLIAVVAPLVLFPVLIVTMRTVERAESRRLEQAIYPYTVDGTLAEEARGWVGEALALVEARRDTAEARSDTAEASYRFEERAAEDADALLEAAELQLVVRAYTPGEFRAVQAAEALARRASDRDRPEGPAAGRELTEPLEAAGPMGAPEAADPAQEAGAAAADVPVLRLLYRADSNLSRRAADRMASALAALRGERRERLYQERGLPVDPRRVAEVATLNVASAEREGGALLGLALTPLLLFLMLSGGSIVAADAIAGEKERGTLETLLTTAASRAQIVRAKMLSIIAVGLVVALVNVLNLLAYLVVGVVDLPEGIRVSVGPGALAVILLLFVPLTVLVASVLLLVSGYARSYKEYQIYFFPVFWLFVVPSLAGMLPGMELRSLIAVVPIANIGVAVREVMVGEYDWPFLLLAFASTSLAAGALASLTGRALSTERLISQADLDEADLAGGPALFPRRVLRWFAVMWVLLLLIALWFGETLGVRGQVMVNILGLFLGGTLLMIWRYRLPVREALALRPVKPAVWLAVLIGAPSALLVGAGVAQLAQYVLPVSERMIESFGQYLLPEAVPLWQLLLFLAVLPGICEELAFRGVLLYGLKRYLRPVPLALVVGLIFGLFHVSLFRIVPTAYLGVVLASVTLLTGSIFPAIVWHALNNAAALVPAHLGWTGAELETAGWAYGVAAAGLALAFWILWRERTPYPGLGQRAPGRDAAERAGEAVGTS